MTARIYHRVRLHPSLEQQQQLKRWRQPLADLQLCADLLLTAILDGRTPERLDDLAALLAAARGGDADWIDSNRAVVSHVEVRKPGIYTRDRFKKMLNAVLRLMIAEEPERHLLPVGTVEGLCWRWYGGVVQPASRVMGDLPHALPALRINDFFCDHALALGDTTLRLMVKALDCVDLTPLDLPAEIFALPLQCRQLARSTDKPQGHPSEVVVQVTTTGTWAWLSFLAPVLPARTPEPTQHALGIDPNVSNLMTGWDGTVVPNLITVPKAATGTLESWRRAYLEGETRIEALIDQLLTYRAIGVEGTGLGARATAKSGDLWPHVRNLR